MINGKLDQFLDTGWYSEATLYLNGHIYWCEAQYINEKNENYFFIDKWCATNENNKYYHSILNSDGTLSWNRIYEDYNSDIELIKKHFLEAKIFDDKSFWEVESEIAWLEESTPITAHEDTKK